VQQLLELGVSAEEVAQRTGVEPEQLAVLRRMAALPDEAWRLIDEGALSIEDAAHLAQLENRDIVDSRRWTGRPPRASRPPLSPTRAERDRGQVRPPLLFPTAPPRGGPPIATPPCNDVLARLQAVISAPTKLRLLDGLGSSPVPRLR
jgi:hypothetical protein